MKLRRPTKRTLLVLLLFIVGGAIINVAVAWGCAWNAYGWVNSFEDLQRVTARFRNRHASPAEIANLGIFGWKSGMPIDAPTPIVFVAENAAFGFLLSSFSDPPMLPLRTIIEAGYPYRSMQGDRWNLLTNGISPSKGQPGTVALEMNRSLYVWERTTHFSKRMPVYFPLQPLWPGFAINTIFYAGILWLLFIAPGFVRRRIRIMRHRCTACGYLIGTSPVCTECGVPVKQLRDR